MSQIDYAEFPYCMHALNAAMHRHFINPSDIVIELPRDDWWKLSQVIQSMHKDLVLFDGRQHELEAFCYMAFTFKVRK